MRPATNEETEGIETVASLLRGLTEAVLEGRTRHFDDISDEDDEETVVERDVMDVPLGIPDSKPEPEIHTSANLDVTSRSSRSETHVEPESEVSASIDMDMGTGASDRRVRFREEVTGFPRQHLDASLDWESMLEPRGKRQDERRPVNMESIFDPPRQVRPSFPMRVQLEQVTVQLESDSTLV